MNYVYILKSIARSDWHYVGVTKDLRRRFKEHNDGKCRTTKADRPWRVDTYIGFSDELRAKSFEKYLKSGSGWSFLKRRL